MLSSPALLAADHQLHGFACGVDTLDDWLKRRAKPNQDGNDGQIGIDSGAERGGCGRLADTGRASRSGSERRGRIGSGT